MNDLPLIDAARAAKILGSRWEHDPLRLWKPAARQQLFLESTKSEVALLGANRSGKSDPLAALVASLARFGNPNPGTSYAAGGRLEIMDRAVSIWVVGLTEKLMKEGIQPKIVTTTHTAAETHPAFIPPIEIRTQNLNDQLWQLKNGSIISFKSADAGRDVFQSAAKDLIAFDEICDEEVYKECMLRVSGANRRLLIRLAATLLPPIGQAGGVSWYFPRKIKPWWKLGNKENRTGNPDEFLDIFTMGMRDNPHIDESEIRRLESIFPPGTLEHEIRINGALIESIGGVRAYPTYRSAIHCDPNVVPANRDLRWPLGLAVDFNVAPLVWEIGQRIDDCWYWFDEIKLDQGELDRSVIAAATQEFRNRYPTHNAPLHIYGDQMGNLRHAQTGRTNYYLMQEELKGYPVPIRMMLPTRNPPEVARMNAMNRALSGADGAVRFIHGPACAELQADLEEVKRNSKGGILKSHDPISSYYQRTHASDAAGYAVTYTDPVPEFVAGSDARRHFSIPSPGGFRAAGPGRAGSPPVDYGMDRRFTMGRGGIIAPRK